MNAPIAARNPGAGSPATPAELTDLGITDPELEQLAQLYTIGTSLWRVRLLHFTPADLNFSVTWYEFWVEDDSVSIPQGYGMLGTEPNPEQARTDDDNKPDDESETCGSIILCESQILGEAVGVVGTPFTLHYQTNRTPGYLPGRTLTVPLIGAQVSDSLKRIHMRISIAGKVVEDTFAAAPDQQFTLVWDGKDAYGRNVNSPQPVNVSIGYVYPYYYAIYRRDCAAGRGGGWDRIIRCNNVQIGAREEEGTRWIDYTISADGPGALQTWDARAQGLGGWTLDVHHRYDPVGRFLEMGDGRRRSAQSVHAVITRLAGAGDCPTCPLGDGGPAVDAYFDSPRGIAMASNGDIYVADGFGRRVRRIDRNGLITTVAGNGSRGTSGDGGPATAAQLDFPEAVALGPDGSLYIADGSRVRRVAPDGIITTVAGQVTSGFAGDEGPATQALLFDPQSLAIAPDGSLYIADTFNHRVRRVGLDGTIYTVAGNGENCPVDVADTACGDGGAATMAKLNFVQSIALGRDGSLYISEGFRIRRVSPDGIIDRVAGTGFFCDFAIDFECGDGGPATAATFRDAPNLALGRDGSIYLANQSREVIRRIDPAGIITTVAGDKFFSSFGEEEGNPAMGTDIGFVHSVVVAPDGALIISERRENTIRRIAPPMPGFNGGDLAIPSEDGMLVYRFTDSGRHLETLDALTGATVYEFGYDASGRLVTVTDADSLTTTIERDASGQPLRIVSPFGQVTELLVDSAGYLARMTNPAGDSIRFGYSGTGLLTSMTDARGNTKTYTYNAIGRLEVANDAAGGGKTLARLATALGAEVTLTTELGRSTRYLYETFANGDTRSITTSPDGLATEVLTETSGVVTTTAPDGTVMRVWQGPDPRFGMQAPVTDSLIVVTPGGLTSVTTATRTATLADPDDPLTLESQIDSVRINGLLYTTAFDAASSLFTSVTPVGRRTFTEIDSLRRVVRDSIRSLFGVHYTYDADGRPDAISQGNRTLQAGFDAAGFLASVTDPILRTDSFTYDPAGRLTRQVLPDGRELLYGYDAAGNLTSLTPPGRPAHTFTYNEVDLLESYTPPDVGGPRTTMYSYNLDRQLTEIARPDGRSVDFGYNAAGRLDTLGFSRGALRFSYSPTTGNLTQITAPGGNTLAYTYDGSLLTGVSWAGEVSGSVDVTYDNNFRVTEQRVNGADTAAFGYDDDGLLTSAGALTLARSAANRLLTGTTLGGVTTSQTYNGFGELATYTAAFSGTDTLYRAVYTRDLLGRITRKVETVEGVTDTLDYTYDVVGRLEEVQKNGQVVESYTYDANGNRLSATYPSGTVTGTYDDQDRLLTYGSASYGYTAAGELRMKVEGADTTRYTYDELGNLVEVVLPDSTLIEYVIDGQNRRVGKRVNGALVQGFLYGDQLNPVAELDSTGAVVARFVYGSRLNVPEYMVKAGVRYRIVGDHLGSVRLVVDAATGQVAQRIDYDAFGRVIQNTDPRLQPFTFVGGLADLSIAFVRFGRRDYDPEIGRMTAKDRLLFQTGSNAYSYSLENPVNIVDIDGEAAAVLAAVGGVVLSPVGLAVLGGLIGAGVVYTVWHYLAEAGFSVSDDVVGPFCRLVDERSRSLKDKLRRLLTLGGLGAALGGAVTGATDATPPERPPPVRQVEKEQEEPHPPPAGAGSDPPKKKE